jgi:hypothetical protein
MQECASAKEQLMLAHSLIKTERQEEIYSYFEEIVRGDCP